MLDEFHTKLTEVNKFQYSLLKGYDYIRLFCYTLPPCCVDFIPYHLQSATTACTDS